MARKRLLWQLYPFYLLITLASVIAVAWYALSTLRGFYLDEVATNLMARAHLVEIQLKDRIGTTTFAEIDSLCEILGVSSDTRVTLILPSGQVIGDSDEEAALMENHANRPEIAEALRGEIGESQRYSRTVNKMLMYVALPVRDGDSIAAVIRTSIPVSAIDEVLGGVKQKIVLQSLIILVVAALVSLIASRQITQPLKQLRAAAQRFARGELDGRVAISGSEEIAGLAVAMNQMAAQLDERIRTVTTQRNLQEAILSSMSEGIIAVDTEQRIIDLNRAAAEMVGVTDLNPRGRQIQEIVRSSELRRLVSEALAGSDAVEGDIIFRRDGERFVQGHGTVLRDAANVDIGVLVVLNDVTRLKRLERVRRDFVANVSHELKTPITSIKGFVETLLDSPMEDLDEVKRFLDIIGRQTDRLNAIIEDLLSLSRIEQEADKAEVALEMSSIKEVLVASLQACQPHAEARNIAVLLNCDKQLQGRVNAALLEQAVTNLIDNAIKYSQDGTQVRVSGFREETSIKIEVKDQGIGIAKEHLPRIFERFYRADKGRSRKLGGTGLGLAISKHIALAHGGRITAESILREGSTFTIVLPQG